MALPYTQPREQGLTLSPAGIRRRSCCAARIRSHIHNTSFGEPMKYRFIATPNRPSKLTVLRNFVDILRRRPKRGTGHIFMTML
ncbi:hypothetical protein Cob_v004028 [Colletotrichum orbiculare MAFF 240422]|uniref:Uncharacterized protein n=1 Tax=Colletotrichum orbiculare (strain 104-T / ATCC 96160 / CBS 514.97 / LARS 414 / MAFF 240422) TaxID=1213857 RepID=A0A484FXA9_COLOR|nr:hypothetical protein Cob_v004028 [Colletotrichum orbiculare MAFF 240422]